MKNKSLALIWIRKMCLNGDINIGCVQTAEVLFPCSASVAHVDISRSGIEAHMTPMRICVVLLQWAKKSAPTASCLRCCNDDHHCHRVMRCCCDDLKFDRCVLVAQAFVVIYVSG